MSENKVTIALDDLKSGITLPVAVYDGRKTSLLLVNRGLVLTESLIRRLKARGVSTVSVDSTFADQLQKDSAWVPLPIRSKSRSKSKSRSRNRPSIWGTQPVAIKPRKADAPPTSEAIERVATLRDDHSAKLNEIYQATEQAGTIAASTLHDITLESVMCLTEDLDVFVQLCIEPTEPGECSQHAMRVSQLALSVGAVLGFTRDQLSALGVGCLLHRVGMTDRVRELTEMNRALTDLELLEIRKVPGRTFDILQQVNNIPHTALQVAYQIYERWNGSGYPRGRVGVQINPLARVASVCDVYVALTSDRPHREALKPYEAIEQVLQMARRGLFDPTAVRGLLQTVSLYPLGSFVTLNDGTMARVVRTNLATYDRPVVQLYNPITGEPERQTVDLSTVEHLHVVEVNENDAVDSYVD